jgi:hypothetical protein
LGQTDGQELEPITVPEWNAERALTALSIERIPFDHTDGNIQGFARKRQVAINPLAQLPFKTLFHELDFVKAIDKSARTVTMDLSELRGVLL